MKVDRLHRLIKVSIYTNLYNKAFPNTSGWWAENFAENIPGSMLFTFDREKITAETLISINRQTAKALEWLTTKRLAAAVKTSSKRLKSGIEITVTVDANTFRYKFPAGGA